MAILIPFVSNSTFVHTYTMAIYQLFDFEPYNRGQGEANNDICLISSLSWLSSSDKSSEA